MSNKSIGGWGIKDKTGLVATNKNIKYIKNKSI